MAGEKNMGVEYRKVEKRLAFYQIMLILNYSAQSTKQSQWTWQGLVIGEWIWSVRLSGRIQDLQQTEKDYCDNSQNTT